MGEDYANDFPRLVAHHYQALYRFAFSLSKRADDAADLVQQVFLLWAQKGHTLRDPSKAKSWLFTSLYRDFLRNNRRNQQLTPTDQALLQETPDASLPNSRRTLDAKEALAALDKLDPVYREPLLLFYIDDLSYKEIANILEIPIGTVMSRLSRGKALLKDVLSENSGK